MAMVTARARVPAMACVGGPASGRGARRRRDLWRSSASRVAVTSKPLRQVEDFGDRRSKEQSADGDFPNALPNLGRQTGYTDRHTDTQKKGTVKAVITRAAASPRGYVCRRARDALLHGHTWAAQPMAASRYHAGGGQHSHWLHGGGQESALA